MRHLLCSFITKRGTESKLRTAVSAWKIILYTTKLNTPLCNIAKMLNIPGTVFLSQRIGYLILCVITCDYINDHIGYTEDAGPTVQPRKDKWVQPRWRSIVCSKSHWLVAHYQHKFSHCSTALTDNCSWTKRSKCDSIRQMFVLGLNSEANGEVP